MSVSLFDLKSLTPGEVIHRRNSFSGCSQWTVQDARESAALGVHMARLVGCGPLQMESRILFDDELNSFYHRPKDCPAQHRGGSIIAGWTLANGS